MNQFLTFVHVIVSVLLILSILMQHRASGLSATFGGTGTTYIQRRGAEQLLYKASIWMSVLFFVIPLLQWYL